MLFETAVPSTPTKVSKTWQYIGQNPCPSVALHELDAIALGCYESEAEAAAEQLRLEMEREEKEAKRERPDRQSEVCGC